MRYTAIFLVLLLASCSQPAGTDKQLQGRVDSIQHALNNLYKPELGEFMLLMQAHHQKLWHAGKAGNWKLAAFETSEMKEIIGNIRKYAADRKEVAELDILDPAIDSMASVADKKDAKLFERNFMMLTTSCNSCHTKVGYEFNKIKVPGSNSFPNQEFGME